MKTLVLSLLSLLWTASAFAAAPGYHVIGKIKIGGEGGWDYLTMDSAARRLYLSHATHVVVLDVDTGKVPGAGPLDVEAARRRIPLRATLGVGFQKDLDISERVPFQRLGFQFLSIRTKPPGLREPEAMVSDDGS
jgi:hypothetical protein